MEQNNSLIADAFGSQSLHEIHLTQREIQCAQWLCLGLTAREIGSQLNLSKRTIETHIEQLKYKLNVTRKSALVQVLLQKEIVSFESIKYLGLQ